MMVDVAGLNLLDTARELQTQGILEDLVVLWP